jgi:hypothetical protein
MLPIPKNESYGYEILTSEIAVCKFCRRRIHIKPLWNLIFSLCIPGEVIIVRPMYSFFHCAWELEVETFLYKYDYVTLLSRGEHMAKL